MKKIKEIYDYEIRGRLYRFVMRLAHKYNWHYAPPIYPEGDVQLWCKWCGLRQTIKRHGDKETLNLLSEAKK